MLFFFFCWSLDLQEAPAFSYNSQLLKHDNLFFRCLIKGWLLSHCPVLAVSDIVLWRDEKKTFICALGLFLLFYWFLLSGRTFVTSMAELLFLSSVILFGYCHLPSSLYAPAAFITTSIRSHKLLLNSAFPAGSVPPARRSPRPILRCRRRLWGPPSLGCRRCGTAEFARSTCWPVEKMRAFFSRWRQLPYSPFCQKDLIFF